MAGKYTGASISGGVRQIANRRNALGILRQMRDSNADIRKGIFEGPIGKTFAYAKTPGSDTRIVVSNPSGRTFRKGAVVPVGSFSGAPGEFIIAGPPAGAGGSRRSSRMRRPVSTIDAPINQYAFYDDGVTLYAWSYLDGTYIADRGTTTGANGTPYSCILSDAQSKVGAGSVLLGPSNMNYPDSLNAALSAGDEVQVWDVGGGALHSRTVPAGHSSSRPLYGAGYLWWVECDVYDYNEDHQYIYCHFYRADCDFGNVTLLATWTSSAVPYYGYPVGHNYLSMAPFGAAVCGSSFVAWLGASTTDNAGGDGTASWLLEIGFDGSGMTPNGTAPNTYIEGDPGEYLNRALTIGSANASGNAVGVAPVKNQYGYVDYRFYSVREKTPDTTTDSSPLWPFTDWLGSWPSETNDFSPNPHYYVRMMNVSPSGALVQVKVAVADGQTLVLPWSFHRDSAISAPSGDAAAVVFTPEAHPTLGEAYIPSDMFYFGD